MCIHGRIETECPECRRLALGEAGYPDEIPFEVLDGDDDTEIPPIYFGAPGTPAEETLRGSQHRTLARAAADLRAQLTEFQALLKRLEATDSPAASGVAAILRSLK